MITFPSAVKEGRPIRLSEETRIYAYESLQGKYGRQIKKTPYVSMDDVEGFAELSPYDRHDAMISRIVCQSPVRIAKGELFCGSASLYEAVNHVLPAFYQGKPVLTSMSHLTCNFDKVLMHGLDFFKNEIQIRLTRGAGQKQTRFLHSLLHVYEAICLWHKRYMDEIQRRAGQAETSAEQQYYKDLADNLKNVPFQKPSSFRQALQSLWFTFAFTRLCGNWPGLGRVDEMLEPFLQADLDKGLITLDQARELIANFLIKGCEWITLDNAGSGDAQHYQNIILAGINSEGIAVEGNVTRLILEVVEELPISDFPISVRINKYTPGWLKEKMASVIRHGGGVVAVYNEDLVIGSLYDFGYDMKEARKFANDGCWEVQIPGKTRFSYFAMDIMLALQEKVLGLHEKELRNRSYDNYEELYHTFLKEMDSMIYEWQQQADNFCDDETPYSVVALFEEGCIENARDYCNGGPVYNCFSLHLGGVPDVVNCLYAIKKLVFEEKKVTLDELIDILKNNWKDAEPLRQYVRNAYTYYGNDSDEVDSILVDVMEHYVNHTWQIRERNHIKRPPGISTFGRQIAWRNMRHATAHGFKNGDILANNLSPTPSTDRKGPTAVIRSHCKVDFSRLTCGTALDLRLDPSTAGGQQGIDSICGLLEGFLELGGFFMQIDVLDASVLEKAQKHPEQYQNLAVRISGWSARFVTLDEEWQRMVIERAK